MDKKKQDKTEYYNIVLDAVYKAFRNATLDELIELSKEDSEWVDKHNYDQKDDREMNLMAHKKEYAKQYADMVKAREINFELSYGKYWYEGKVYNGVNK